MRRRAVCIPMLAFCGVGCGLATPAAQAPDPRIEEVPTGIPGMLLDVEFRGPRLGLAVGGTGERDSALMTRTTDGGQTWTSVDVGAAGRLYGVAFASDAVACAAGYGVLLRTTDGGVSWSDVEDFPAPLPWVGGIAFADARTGYAVGGGGEPVLWRTDDAGLSWQDASAALPDGARGHGLRAIGFLDERRGVALGDGGLLLVSEDGGKRWERYPTGADEAWLKGLGLLDTEQALVAGSHGSVLRTTDGATTWAPCPFEAGDKLNIAGVLDEATLYVGSMEGRLFQSTDTGASWQVVLETLGRPLIGSARRETGDTATPELWFSCDDGVLLRIRRPAPQSAGSQ